MNVFLVVEAKNSLRGLNGSGAICRWILDDCRRTTPWRAAWGYGGVGRGKWAWRQATAKASPVSVG